MRYLLLTYYKKPDGKIDEVMAVAKNLKKRDLATCNVILDFKTLTVIKCSMAGTTRFTSADNWVRKPPNRLAKPMKCKSRRRWRTVLTATSFTIWNEYVMER